MGGGLAAFAGTITKTQTITFNAAGIHPNTLTSFGIAETSFSHITNHITRGDILTKIQQGLWLAPEALGSQTYHGRVINEFVPTSILQTINGIEQHGNT